MSKPPLIHPRLTNIWRDDDGVTINLFVTCHSGEDAARAYEAMSAALITGTFPGLAAPDLVLDPDRGEAVH